MERVLGLFCMCEGERGEGERRELRKDFAEHGIHYSIPGINHLKYNICTEGLIQVICTTV